MRKNTIAIQATGLMPIGLTPQSEFKAEDSLDKRTVSLDLYLDTMHCWWYKLTLLSDWDDERTHTMIGGPFIDDKDHLELMVSAIHHDAALILPPGAGYPATPEYDARQVKLKGQLYWVTLSCLSSILSKIHQEQGQKP